MITKNGGANTDIGQSINEVQQAFSTLAEVRKFSAPSMKIKLKHFKWNVKCIFLQNLLHTQETFTATGFHQQVFTKNSSSKTI